MGWLVWLLSPTYRRRIAANVALAGVGAAAGRQAVVSAGRMVTELPWLWLRPHDEALGERIRWQGVERLDAAVAARRPIVLLTPHMGSFEVAARAYVERHGATQPLTVLFRPAKQAWLHRFQQLGRQRPMLATAPANLAGVRQMLRALKKGETIGLLPDQVPPAGQGVWAPFFGQPAYTMTLAAKLLLQTGAEPVVFRCERLPRGQGWCVHVTGLAGELPPGNDEAAQIAQATVINRSMEATILADPGQYLWGYHRYKKPRESEGTPGAPAPAAAASTSTSPGAPE